MWHDQMDRLGDVYLDPVDEGALSGHFLSQSILSLAHKSSDSPIPGEKVP